MLMNGDKELPACIEGACLIPELDEAGTRILTIREKIISLNGLVDSGPILNMYEAGLEDLELLAFIEEELKKLKTDSSSS